jgi:hypothetical protein
VNPDPNYVETPIEIGCRVEYDTLESDSAPV